MGREMVEDTVGDIVDHPDAPETEELRGLSLLAGGEWVDLLPAQEGEEDLLSLAFRLLPALPKLLAFPEDGGPSLELPSAGLEALTLPDPDSVG